MNELRHPGSAVSEVHARLLQKEYYSSTAQQYDAMHLEAQDDEHRLALGYLEAIVSHFRINSILDVGAGTGRVAQFLRQRRPELRVVSIEPVEALRRIRHE
jgi:ubiquinone/menaquinone biosynthesis C-methylase UbiE